MDLADVVATSDALASTSSTSAKVATLAGLLAAAEVDDLRPVVGLLTGRLRQGRLGLGWATLASLSVEPAATPTLKVVDLDAAVTTLAALAGPGSEAVRRATLTGLMARATVDEAAFVRRLLLGELRQGALEGVMTDAVARAAGVPLEAVRRALMLAGDLGEVAAVALEGGEEGLAGVRLDVLRPVLPMLASGATDVAAAVTALAPCSIEWKLDGARIQAHRRGSDVRLYTRNLHEVTDRLPDLVGLLRSLPGTAFVLDGEVLGSAEEGPHAFQDTMSSFGRRSGPPGAAVLAAWFFDCLHLDGDDLVDRPLSARLEALERAGAPRVPALATDDVEQASAFEASALAAGHEGVMVKALSSRYEAGRRGRAWQKVKPVRTLDLLVTGAEWGSGRRHGWLSNLHLAARDSTGEPVMVGKTFKGLSDALLAWQTQELLARESARQGHVVEIDPPLVVEIALDGALASTRYPGGVALRFARVRRYRPDKRPDEADTIDAVRALLPRRPQEPGGRTTPTA